MKIRNIGWGEQFRWTFDDPECAKLLEEQRQTMRSLRVAYDNDGLWNWGGPDQISSIFAQMVDQYAAAGAPFLSWGAGSQQAWNFRPTVMEAAWQERELPGVPKWRIDEWHIMRELVANNTDPLTILLEQAQRCRLPITANFRFNRYHPERGMTDRWFVEHPQFHLSPASCPWVQTATNPWPSQALINLAHAEVREHLVCDLIDVVENYPVDGLQLELLRAIPLFELDEPSKAEHMNDFVRLLRKELDRIGQHRGRHIKLVFWLPIESHHRHLRGSWPAPFLDEANWGLDPATWIEEELVDILIPSLYSQDLAMPGPASLPPWLAQARERSIEVYGCVMNISTMVEDGVTSCARTVDIIRSTSASCDGVFLINSQPIHLAAVVDAAQRTQPAGRSISTALFPATAVDSNEPVDPPGIVFLEPNQIYEFRSQAAHRITVAPPPAGKPYVIRMANGELLTAYTRNYVADLPRSNETPFYTEIRWSTDDGETWSEPVRPYPPDVLPFCKEGTLVPLAGGAVICLTHGRKGDDHYVTPMITISEDFGRTWCTPWKLDVSAMFPTNRALSNRTHIPLDDGSAILFFTDFSVESYETWACISRDQGRTHEDYWLVGQYIGDQSFVRLPSGRFLAAVRVFGEVGPDKGSLPYGYHPEWAAGLGGGEAHDYIAITESEDGGRTWSPYRPITKYGEVPSQLLVLDNGSILLTHGVRHYPMGAQAMISRDEGKTWDLDHRYMLAWHGAPYSGSLPDWGHPYPNGHPYSVQRSDGRILTLYYRTMYPDRFDSTVIEGVVWQVPNGPDKQPDNTVSSRR